MKSKVLALVTVAGFVTGAYGQSILMQNTVNSGGILATTGGLIYTNTTSTTTVGAGIFNGLANNVGVEITGGPTGGSFSAIGLGLYKANTDPKGFTGFDMGKFQLGNAKVAVPGVAAGGVAQIQLKMWYDGDSAGGLFANYAAASAGLGKVATATWFDQATENQAGSPPVVPQAFATMPSMMLAPVPEPSTIALAGLGVGALWLLRRRK